MAAPSASFADRVSDAQFSPQNAQSALSAQSKGMQKPSRESRGMQTRSLSGTSYTGLGGAHWISVARQYKGTNPTGRRSLWCADFLNLVLQRSGMKGTSSSTARSFAAYGERISGPRVGAIAVISRGKTAGHVGIVTGVDDKGNPIIISGNHNNTVAEATYSAGRVIAYVWPAG
jgi:uncharacterized protein (TIGR02594 family)